MPRRNKSPEPWNVTSRQVAEFFGVNVETVYRMKPFQLQYMTIGKQRRYRWSDVETFVERSKP